MFVVIIHGYAINPTSSRMVLPFSPLIKSHEIVIAIIFMSKVNQSTRLCIIFIFLPAL